MPTLLGRILLRRCHVLPRHQHRIGRDVRDDAAPARVAVVIDVGKYLVGEEIAVDVLLLDALDLIVDYLQYLIGHDKVVLLPHIDEMLTLQHLIGLRIQIHFNDLQLVVPRLHDIIHVESHSFENARQLEH